MKAPSTALLARVIVALLCALVLAFAALPAQAMRIERVISPGGIEAWLVRDPAVPLVAVDFAIVGGSAQDPQDKAGLANMMSALLDEGAGALDAKAFHQRLERKAIELSFRAGRDYIRGTLRTLKENREEAFEYLRLALNEPRFDREAVDRIRAQTMARLRRESTSPNDIAYRNWWGAAFPGHPYGRTVNGTIDSVAAITVEDLRSQAGRVLTRQTLKIAMVGDIDIESAGRLLDRTFGSLPANSDLKPVPGTTPQGLGRRIVVELDVPQAVVTFGGPGVGRSDPDFFAAYIVNHILGGGTFSSRLYREVREKRGLAYGVSESLVWFKNSAVTIGGTAVRAEKTGDAIAIIEQEVKRMADEGPTADELTGAKSYLKGAYPLSLDTSSKIASQLVFIQNDNLGIDYIQRRDSMIDAVTIEDAKRAAKRLFGSGLLITVAGQPQGVTSTD